MQVPNGGGWKNQLYEQSFSWPKCDKEYYKVSGLQISNFSRPGVQERANQTCQPVSCGGFCRQISFLLISSLKKASYKKNHFLYKKKITILKWLLKYFGQNLFLHVTIFQGYRVRRHLNYNPCFLLKVGRTLYKVSNSCFSRVTISYNIKRCREIYFGN